MDPEDAWSLGRMDSGPLITTPLLTIACRILPSRPLVVVAPSLCRSCLRTHRRLARRIGFPPPHIARFAGPCPIVISAKFAAVSLSSSSGLMIVTTSFANVAWITRLRTGSCQITRTIMPFKRSIAPCCSLRGFPSNPLTVP